MRNQIILIIAGALVDPLGIIHPVTRAEEIRSYSDYYNRDVTRYYGSSPSSYGSYSSSASSESRRWSSFDNQYKSRNTVSPYINLTRRSGPYINNYYEYVRPEIQRQPNFSDPPRAYARPENSFQFAPSPSTYAPAPSAPTTRRAPSSYFEAHYSNRRDMGLPP